MLAALPAAELRKTRRFLVVDGRRFAVDELHGRHRGLVLVETELLDTDETVAPPSPAIREVTHDDRFSGGALAGASDAAAAALVDEVVSPGAPGGA